MIDKRHAGNEVGRMVGLEYFPTDQKAVRELVTALTFAATEAIATAVVNDWMESQSQRPTPADLRRSVATKNEDYAVYLKAGEVAPTIYCRRCGDCGLFGGQIGTEYDGLWRWCDCNAGGTRQESEPNLVDEANAAREKLLTRLGKKTLQAMIGARAKQSEPYHGEF